MARATCGWSANVRLGESLGRISFRTNRDDRAFAETWCRTAPESRFMVCGLLFTIATDGCGRWRCFRVFLLTMFRLPLEMAERRRGYAFPPRSQTLGQASGTDERVRTTASTLSK